MFQLKYLPDAVTDRATIETYLSQYYKGTAKKFFDLLKKKTSRLKEFPYSCSVYTDDPDYRRLVVGEYLVFYIVNEEYRTIEIHRIFHGTQDIKRFLKS